MSLSDHRWEAVHLRYRSPIDRRALIDALGVVDAPAPWFFVDGVEPDALEIAAGSDLGVRLAAVPDGPQGVIHPPCALQVLGPAGRDLADAYARALAAHTARAVARLGDPDGPSDDLVAAELARIHEEAAPEPEARLAHLHSHADWLDRVAARSGAPTLPPDEVRVREVRVRDAISPTATGRDTLTELRQAAATRAGKVSFAALVSRLAHTQVVRLRGPGRDDQLGWERSVVAALARGAATSST